MKVRIFTLPFKEEVQGFEDDLIHAFCQNKKVHEMKSEFFTNGGKPYWTVIVIYDILIQDEGKAVELDEKQKILYEELRKWRAEQAEKDGYPVFLVCNNKQLVQVIQQRCTSLEKLRSIKGFGKQKIAKYGKSITEIIKRFYQ